MANRLRQEKSPYLLQHGENPVDWYPWCAEAFQRAKEADRPVFLSIGYSTCHWCHVMAHESFEDEAVAQLLNREFICIKVDREERPDIDAVYMAVCQALTGSGGWPLTILMTPEQKPFFAGTYFPKRGVHGRFGLMELLERAALLWRHDRSALLRAGEQITGALQQQQRGGGQTPDQTLVNDAYAGLRARFDPIWGGFGPAPKFPAPHDLLFLLQYAERMQARDARHMVEVTLCAMARGGIHDQIGGGFSRYSTDESWLVPHFEKMLYDNALLLLAYLKAWQDTKKEIYADVSRRTAGYLLHQLRGSEGGFFCGQDADSDGEEGKYYLFTPEEVTNALGEADGADFCRRYDITQTGNFDGKNIPNRIKSGQDAWPRDDPRIKALQDFRRKRTTLHTDDKILLSWNAWAMLALAEAGRTLGEQNYLDAAVGIHDFIERKMTDTYGRLYLRYRDKAVANAGQLEDYAVYALALLVLYRADFDAAYLQAAIRRAEQMVMLFEDEKNGGYYMTALDAERLIVWTKQIYDGAMPSGNSVAAMVLQELAALTGQTQWRQAAERQLAFLAGEIKDAPAAACFGVMAIMDALHPRRELICATKDALPCELREYLKAHPEQQLQILVKTEENASLLAACAPFTGAYPVPRQGAVYYPCDNGACKAPATEFRQLGL